VTDEGDDDRSQCSDHVIYGNSKSNVDGKANSGTGNTDPNYTSNQNDSDNESLFLSHEGGEISISNVDGEANNGTSNTDTNDTSHMHQDVETVENVDESNTSTIQRSVLLLYLCNVPKTLYISFIFCITLFSYRKLNFNVLSSGYKFFTILCLANG
jgi:hypothetical protein